MYYIRKRSQPYLRDDEEQASRIHFCQIPAIRQMATALLLSHGKISEETALDYEYVELSRTQHDILHLKPCALCAFAMCRSPDGKTACGMEEGCMALGRGFFFIPNTPEAKREIHTIIKKAYKAFKVPNSLTK